MILNACLIFFVVVLTTAHPMGNKNYFDVNQATCEAVFMYADKSCDDVTYKKVHHGCTLFCICNGTYSEYYTNDNFESCGKKKVCYDGECQKIIYSGRYDSLTDDQVSDSVAITGKKNPCQIIYFNNETKTELFQDSIPNGKDCYDPESGEDGKCNSGVCTPLKYFPSSQEYESKEIIDSAEEDVYSKEEDYSSSSEEYVYIIYMDESEELEDETGNEFSSSAEPNSGTSEKAETSQEKPNAYNNVTLEPENKIKPINEDKKDDTNKDTKPSSNENAKGKDGPAKGSDSRSECVCEPVRSSKTNEEPSEGAKKQNENSSKDEKSIESSKKDKTIKMPKVKSTEKPSTLKDTEDSKDNKMSSKWATLNRSTGKDEAEILTTKASIQKEAKGKTIREKEMYTTSATISDVASTKSGGSKKVDSDETAEKDAEANKAGGKDVEKDAAGNKAGGGKDAEKDAAANKAEGKDTEKDSDNAKNYDEKDGKLKKDSEGIEADKKGEANNDTLTKRTGSKDKHEAPNDVGKYLSADKKTVTDKAISKDKGQSKDGKSKKDAIEDKINSKDETVEKEKYLTTEKREGGVPDKLAVTGNTGVGRDTATTTSDGSKDGTISKDEDKNAVSDQPKSKDELKDKAVGQDKGAKKSLTTEKSEGGSSDKLAVTDKTGNIGVGRDTATTSDGGKDGTIGKDEDKNYVTDQPKSKDGLKDKAVGQDKRAEKSLTTGKSEDGASDKLAVTDKTGNTGVGRDTATTTSDGGKDGTISKDKDKSAVTDQPKSKDEVKDKGVER